MINNNIKKVGDLLSNCSIETTPNVYAKYGSFTDLVSIKNHKNYKQQSQHSEHPAHH